MAHGIEWQNHEDCLSACTPPDPTALSDIGLEISNGVMVSAQALPGVQSLFQMAVDGTRERVDRDEDEGLERGLHLTRTLGLHGDTPALAPFLGKEVVRREIKVRADQDEEVDIFGLDENRGTKRWQRPLRRRNENANMLYNEPEKDAKQSTQAEQEFEPGRQQQQQGQPATASSSRFHISARIIVTDRSMAIPPGKLSLLPFIHPRMLSRVFRKADQQRHSYVDALSRVAFLCLSFTVMNRHDSLTDTFLAEPSYHDNTPTSLGDYTSFWNTTRNIRTAFPR
jgi:hypothetical protein